MVSLNKSKYFVLFTGISNISTLIIYPTTVSQQKGIADE